jgi:hypothetical protein
MRFGKTEYAMRAPGMTGIAGREVGCALAAVETKLDGRRAFAGLRRERKSAERNQQALRGDGIRDDDADQRSPPTLGPQRLDLIARLNMLPTGKLTLALDLRGRKLAFLTLSLRPHEHKSLAAAFGDQLVVLVVGAMMKLDDAGAGPRLRFALADDLGRRVHGIALE